MGDALRPCPSCGRHYGDEAACPFCGATGFRMPAAPEWMQGEHRPAPKYGGPPMVRAFPWLLVLAIGAAIAILTFLLVR